MSYIDCSTVARILTIMVSSLACAREHLPRVKEWWNNTKIGAYVMENSVLFCLSVPYFVILRVVVYK